MMICYIQFHYCLQHIVCYFHPEKMLIFQKIKPCQIYPYPQELNFLITSLVNYIAQNDIIENNELIKSNTDSLASLIDDVSYTLDNYMRNTDKNFKEVRNDIEDLGIEIRGNIKRLKRNISDVQDFVSTIDKRLKEIEDLSLIQKEKAEAAEEEEE